MKEQKTAEKRNVTITDAIFDVNVANETMGRFNFNENNKKQNDCVNRS